MKHKTFGIVVASFDGYSDLWDPFFDLYFDKWNNESRTYLINNTKVYKRENVSVIHTGVENSWSEKIRTGLQNVEEETILLFLEDYLIGDQVDDDKIQEAYKFFLEKNLEYLRVVSPPKNKGKNMYNKIKSNIRYGVNLQVSFWEKETLMKILNQGNYSAWEFEKLYNEKKMLIDIERCFSSKDQLLNIQNGVIQGKWYPKTIRYFKKQGKDINFDSKIKVMSKKEYYKYQIKNKVKKITPNFVVNIIKPILKKLGIKFTT